jgi:FkbM family methyltransferase
MKLDLDENRPNEKSVLGWLQTGKLFEPDVANLFLNVLRQGDVVIDVGANIGFLTVLASVLVGPTGHVVAFEPGADNLERLRANLGHNDCKNVTVIEKAVTNQVGEVVFYINSDDSGGNALWDPRRYPGTPKTLATAMRLVVPATTLDAEWERLRLPAPKVIKIDTEGAEQRVLEGARDLIARHQPRFITAELHQFGLAMMDCTEVSLRGFIEGLGYSTFGMSYAGTLPRLIPTATRIISPVLINLLFSKPEYVGEYWPTAVVNPRNP